MDSWIWKTSLILFVLMMWSANLIDKQSGAASTEFYRMSQLELRHQKCEYDAAQTRVTFYHFVPLATLCY